MNAIKVTDLSFGFNKKKLVLDKVNMHVPTGSIYGFLGENGAGKSTTIRNILGLYKPKTGTIKILNQTAGNSNYQHYKNIGSLIESPSLYPHLTGDQNLKLIAKYHGLKRFDSDLVLSKVGMIKSKNVKTQKYSTGMKQRLGLAIALIHDPQLLILDEPTNGLDPTGIQEIREVILDLKKEGKTIILSSHLLSEIEKIATHIGVINSGKIVHEGDIQSLKNLQKENSTFSIRCSNTKKTLELLKNLSPKISDNKLIVIQSKGDLDNAEILKKLIDNDISIYTAELEQPNLEKIFNNLTKNKND